MSMDYWHNGYVRGKQIEFDEDPWEADDQTRAHSSGFSQSSVSYGTPFFADDGANEKVSIGDESYMYLWKKRNAQTFLCGVPSLNPESIVDPLTRAVSISLEGRPLSNSVPMNMSTQLDAQRQLGSKAARPYQLLLQVAAVTKSTIEKWFSTMGETPVSGVHEAGATVNYILDASNVRHQGTNPSLCAIMHFDILYSMRQVAIEAEYIFPYIRLATLLWKRVQYVLSQARVPLSWPDVEAVLRKQTIKLMLGKIAPHATAKDFAEAFLSILNHSQDENRCLFLPSTLLKLTWAFIENDDKEKAREQLLSHVNLVSKTHSARTAQPVAVPSSSRQKAKKNRKGQTRASKGKQNATSKDESIEATELPHSSWDRDCECDLQQLRDYHNLLDKDQFNLFIDVV
ncbi:hypothetical protein E8E11_001726 [Didymella keratinophila]|nr:hypothetical protein E8E11_001726 [Didymella keratinophila]